MPEPTPQLLPASADSLSRLYTAESIGLLVQVVRGEVESKTNERIRAAEILLDRGHGRATQAVVSIPARQAVSAALASMSEEALMRIALRAQGGGGSEKGDPNGAPAQAGSPLSDEILPPNMSDEDLPKPRAMCPKPDNGPLVPKRLKHADIVDAEITPIDPYDI